MLSNIIFYNVFSYPNNKIFMELCKILDKKGCNFIEVGIPSSNPYLEGRTISNAHKQIDIDKAKNDLVPTLKWIKEKTNLKVILMTYMDGFIGFNLAELDTDLYDSILCVDNNLSEYPSINKVKFYENNLSDGEIKSRINQNSSFCYINSGLDKTGGSIKTVNSYKALLHKMKDWTSLPLYVGFGVKDKEDKEEVIKNGGDGIIIGSEFIRKIDEDSIDLSQVKKYLEELV